MKAKITNRYFSCKRAIALSALVTAIQPVLPAIAGVNPGEVTISTSGSTALKNWFVAKGNTFTDVTPGTQLTIGGNTYPASNSDWSVNGGSALVYQLAPSNFTTTSTGVAQQAPAIRFEYHESGSVEGILELANDQIATVPYVTNNIDRNPTLNTTSGNNVWVNYGQFGSGKGSWTATTGGSVSGSPAETLGNFYSGSQTYTLPTTANPNPTEPTPSFSLTGVNLGGSGGGQNAVQLAVSDVIPVQAFASTATVDNDGDDSHLTEPWLHTTADAGYGSGDTYLPPAPILGTAGSRVSFQSTTALNMPTTQVDPRTGTNFTSGPWNTAGLGNLNSQLVAVTATTFVANPGTGLIQVNRTDAQWLQLQSRLANGATFNMTTRDVNSGTRNVAALETGIDPTWATGMNDNGNGNASNAGTDQISVGPGLRFSNKTAGGGELRPTVQSARMAVGTLSINDANGSTFQTETNPLRALSFSDTNAGQTPTYVAPSYANIIDGAYTIFQNEQFVTLKAPDATYTNTDPNNIDIQGDSDVNAAATAAGNASGDVRALVGNTLNSVKDDLNGTSAASPAAGLMQQGYILPQLMMYRKDENGALHTFVSPFDGKTYTNVPFEPNTVAFGAAPNQAYNAAAVADPALTNTTAAGKMANGDPSTVTSGSASSVYGGNTVTPNGPTGFNGAISLTPQNYLFGNFNQNGVRDFDAVVVEAQKAQAALESGAAPAGDSAFTSAGGSPNSAKAATGITALDNITGQDGTPGLTKGDLITLGDYNGDGVFNGQDLYAMAFGASLVNGGNAPSGTPGTSSFHTGTMAASTSSSFGADITNAVLYKNAALDYLQSQATTLQKQEARDTFTVTTGSPVPTYAGVPATLVASNVSGNDVYTLDDSNGDDAFNKADVNHDGQINLDDALIVDKFAGESYNSQDNQEAATINANGTIDPTASQQKPISLVAATLIDYGSNDPNVNKIQQGDENVVNSALAGTFNYAWYAGETKVGSLAIDIAPTAGSSIQVPSGSSFTIAGGAFNVGKTVAGGVTTTVANSIDPFTDTTAAAGLDTSKSLAVTVNSATLNYAARTGTSTDTGIKVYRLGSLTVQTGGTVSLDSPANHANRSLLVTGSNLAFSGTGTLDVGANDMIVHNGSPSVIQAQLKTGFIGGAGYWNGTGGIVSTAAANDTTYLTTLGYMQSTGSAFDGYNTAASDVLVKYTYYGDANLDGSVNGADYQQIDNGFGLGLTGWQNGDFNYDGIVDGSDYSLLDNTFNQLNATGASPLALSANSSASIASSSALVVSPADVNAVPEPGSLTLLTIGAAGLLRRRRRRA